MINWHKFDKNTDISKLPGHILICIEDSGIAYVNSSYLEKEGCGFFCEIYDGEDEKWCELTHWAEINHPDSVKQ